MDFLLRKWEKEDAKDIAKAANNLKIAENLRNVFPYPYALEDAVWFINDCIKKEGKRQIARAIDINGAAVGSIGVFQQNDIYEKSGELGYWLSEDFWGQGIVSQAIQLICKEAFQTFDLNRIYAEPFAHNIGSRKALEKAGFQYEGTMKNGVFKNGSVYSYCIYALLRGE
ncbi:MAG: GNAT family N-acetyltransferase [Eubacterium sp.]|nr:GNAT family N-acetyltransferase [Eubacterium sp.]